MNKKIIFSSILLFISLIFAGILVKWAFVEIFFAEPTIVQTCGSPDGEYTAYVYESNGGATSGWTYHVSILPTKRKLGKGNGNIYISNSPPVKLEWLNDRTLYIDDYDSFRTTKRKEKIGDVAVRFKSLEKQR